MAQQEIVVLGDQKQRMMLDMTGDRVVGRLAAEFDGNVRGDKALLPEPFTQCRRQLCVVPDAHQAACTTVSSTAHAA